MSSPETHQHHRNQLYPPERQDPLELKLIWLGSWTCIAGKTRAKIFLSSFYCMNEQPPLPIKTTGKPIPRIPLNLWDKNCALSTPSQTTGSTINLHVLRIWINALQTSSVPPQKRIFTQFCFSRHYTSPFMVVINITIKYNNRWKQSIQIQKFKKTLPIFVQHLNALPHIPLTFDIGRWSRRAFHQPVPLL